MEHTIIPEQVYKFLDKMNCTTKRIIQATKFMCDYYLTPDYSVYRMGSEYYDILFDLINIESPNENDMDKFCVVLSKVVPAQYP